MKHVAFRCDANQIIGSGHFMRCLKLAGYLKRVGCEVAFIMSSASDFVKTKLKDMEIDLLDLAAGSEDVDIENYSSWLPLGVSEDSRKTLNFLEENSVDTLVVDHYGIDIEWQKIFKDKYRIVMIDDLANRTHACDLLVDTNEYLNKEHRYTDLISPNTDLFLGSKFALLDENILEIRNRSSNEDSENKIFVCFGGADPTGETVKFLTAVDKLQNEDSMDLFDYAFEIVVGPFNKKLEEIRSLAESLENVNLSVNPPNLYSVMNGSFFAYGAGGTMTWERAALKLPMAICSVAENQVQLSNDISKAGYAIYLGVAKSLTLEDYARSIRSLVEDTSGYMAPNFMALTEICDGKGIERVANWILN